MSIDKQKQFMKTSYSKYWIEARDSKYSSLKYDDDLIQLMESASELPESVLEVGVGTGVPFASHFNNRGSKVHGVDIALQSVQKCKELNFGVQAIAADAEQLPYRENQFDITFCFHSMPFISRPELAIKEMVRVTRPGGLIFFDIQNFENSKIQSYQKQREFNATFLGQLFQTGKNLLKHVTGYGTPMWSSVVFENASTRKEIMATINQLPIKNTAVYGQLDGMDVPTKEFDETAPLKLIFYLTKNGPVSVD